MFTFCCHDDVMPRSLVAPCHDSSYCQVEESQIPSSELRQKPTPPLDVGSARAKSVAICTLLSYHTNKEMEIDNKK